MNVSAKFPAPSDWTEIPASVAPGSTPIHTALEAIGKSIVSGRYPIEGSFVTEAELCRNFGIARGTLREAVGLLRSKGLVDRSPRLGVWVLPESSWNFLDRDILRWLLARLPSQEIVAELFQIRQAVQPGAAGLAAEVADCKARSIIASARLSILEHPSGSSELDVVIGLHAAILRATGNRLFAQMADVVGTALRLTDRYAVNRQALLALNAQLLPAIAQRILDADAVAARREMHTLIVGEQRISNLELRR